MNDGRLTLVTECGRRLVTGRFLVPVVRPIGRVTLRVDPVSGCCETVWVSLTPAEALRLAEALVAQAHAVEGVEGGAVEGGAVEGGTVA